MTSKKIEYLADRRPPRKGSDTTLRVLRHLDAARTKLDLLMAIRRELKAELRQAQEQHDDATNRIQDLESQVEQQQDELLALHNLLKEQAEELNRLRPGTPRFGFDGHADDSPALTVLAVEKAGTRPAMDSVLDEPNPERAKSLGLFRRLWSGSSADTD